MNGIIREYLLDLYGTASGAKTYDRLSRLMAEYRKRIERPQFARDQTEDVGTSLPIDEQDAILITYGDQFREEGKAPINSLGDFLSRHLKGIVSGVHILPFSPYSSDDGFSVIDYRQVNPEWGDWSDVQRIGRDFRLMFDLVCNHVSAQSLWFKEFLKGNRRYRDYFITVAEGEDLSRVFRPRALPLLSSFDTAAGKKNLWTTFSPDQIDLNYGNPGLLLEIIDILLEYAERGAHWIRLDAIAYLWKTIGTSCIHLEQTHKVVQLFRAVFNVVAPWVMIITETNVPHEDNISYFGNGYNEAQLVYQFPLPPLVLDAFRRGDARHLSDWASGLGELAGNITFFNFLASHDGIGVLPAHGILSNDELAGLGSLASEHGGYVSYKATPDGEIPYELNISYLNAIAHPEEEIRIKAAKFLTSQAVMLALSGVPGIYVHSILGTENFRAGVEQTGMKRSINRRKFDLAAIETKLSRSGSLQAVIFEGYLSLLKARRANPAFNPFAEQRLLEGEKALFSLLRVSRDKKQRLLCIHNTGDRKCLFTGPVSLLSSAAPDSAIDVISGNTVPVSRNKGSDEIEIPVGPYQTLWLKV